MKGYFRFITSIKRFNSNTVLGYEVGQIINSKKFK